MEWTSAKRSYARVADIFTSLLNAASELRHIAYQNRRSGLQTA